MRDAKPCSSGDLEHLAEGYQQSLVSVLSPESFSKAGQTLNFTGEQSSPLTPEHQCCCWPTLSSIPGSEWFEATALGSQRRSALPSPLVKLFRLLAGTGSTRGLLASCLAAGSLPSRLERILTRHTTLAKLHSFRMIIKSVLKSYRANFPFRPEISEGFAVTRKPLGLSCRRRWVSHRAPRNFLSQRSQRKPGRKWENWVNWVSSRGQECLWFLNCLIEKGEKKKRERKKGCGRKSPVNQLASHFQFKYFHKCLAVISMQGMSTAGERFLRWQRIPLDDKLSSDKLQSRQFPFGSPRSLLICSRILRLLKRKASWLSVAFVNLIHWERETVLKCRKIPKFKTPAAYYVFDLNNVPSEKTFTQVLDVSQTALQTSCV